ncbi:MAG: cytochrome P450 [Polyangiaceae bacterium]|nr:cytochrome P450 [Polyangiaceae bacterium]
MLLETERATLQPYRLMPEPPRRALGGHLTEWLGVENAKGVLARLQRYAESCGPVARVTLGPVRMVVISDAHIASAVLDDPRANFKGAAYILTRAVLDNVLLLNGEPWETHRKAYRQALRDVDALGSANRVVERKLDALRAGPLALDTFVNQLVGDVVGDFVAGVELTPGFEPHRKRIQYELAGLGIDLQCQPWAYLSPARWLKLRQSVEAARAFFRSSVEERIRRPRPEARDVLNGFIQLAREGAYPSDAQNLQEGVVNFFFTAHDVLTSSTAWCLHLLSKHPEIQSRLRASLSAQSDGPLDRRALDDNAELGRVICEALRLFPGYALFGRTTQADMPIGGYMVPRGTMLIVSPFVIHRLERHYENAGSFDPDRWRGKSTAPISAMAVGQYMPFGAGARGCLASHLAVPIMKTLVARVIRRFELVAHPTHEPKIAYWGTSYAENGLPVTVHGAAS